MAPRAESGEPVPSCPLLPLSSTSNPSPFLLLSTLLNTPPPTFSPQAHNTPDLPPPLSPTLLFIHSSRAQGKLRLAAQRGRHHGVWSAGGGEVGGVRGLEEPAGSEGPARRHARRLLRAGCGGAGEPGVPGEREQPGDLPDGVHALLAGAVGDDSDQLHGHRVPARAPRRLPLRRLLHHLRHLPHQRLRRVPGLGDPNDPGADAVADAAAVCQGARRGTVRAGVGEQEGDAVRGAVPDGAGRGRHQGLPPVARRRAVRRALAAGPQGPLHLLQLLRLLPLLRRAHRRHLRRVGRGQQGLAVGVRHLHHRHPALHPGLRRGIQALPQQGAYGQPAHHHRQGRPRRRVRSPRGRPERQQRRCHRPRAQPDREHQHGLLQARGDLRRRRGRGRAIPGAEVLEPRGAVPAAVQGPGVHGAGGGERQDRAHGAPHLLLHHHAQLLPCAAVDLLRGAGGDHGHARREAHGATGVAAGVPCHLHHIPGAHLRPRHHPVRAARDGDGDGHHPPPARRHGAGPLHRGDGGCGRGGGEAQERRRRRGDAGLGGDAAAHHLLLDRVPVPVPGVGGPVHAGGASGVLLQRGAGEDAVAGDVAIVGVAGAGVLPELGAGVDRERRDGARGAPAVAAGGEPEPLPPGAVLLGDVRAQHPQLPLLLVLGHPVQVQKRRGHQGVVRRRYHCCGSDLVQGASV